MRRFPLSRVFCFVLFLPFITLCGVGRAQASGTLDPLIAPRASLLTGQSRVVVTARPGSLSTVTQLIPLLGGVLGRSLPIINGRAATVPNISLTTLVANAAVQHIALDRLAVGSLERTGPTIGATSVRQELGLDGSGVGVAVIDSGITAWHDDLSGTVLLSQRVDRFVDFVGGTTTPSDQYGHGTHVAGIIAGNGFDSGGARSGIAPAARLVVLKVLDGSGRGRISDVIAAFDYTVAHKAELNIRVVNLSVATGVYESYNSDPLTLAAKRAVDAGIVVVAAAGNNGRSSQGHTQYGGTTAPGNAPWVLTVGASSHMGTIDRSDDTIPPFSSRGPTAVDRAAKPDIVAPGVGIESLSVPNSALYNTYSAYLLTGTVSTSYPPYLSLSGTSMSTPVVAGTVALMLQANPSLTPNGVKAALQFTAQNYPAYDPLTEGVGFLNAQGAVELAHYLAAPSSVPYPDDTTWSHQLIWGNHLVNGGRLAANANAWQAGTAWGATPTVYGQPITWGTICSVDCDSSGAVWVSWGVSCTNLSCTSVDWGYGSQDVVWGSQCGGSDCSSDTSWTGTDSVSGTTVVWGTSDGSETVVWGTSDGDETVVWGTSCADPSCEPVLWHNP
jgi:serine protease AprX